MKKIKLLKVLLDKVLSYPGFVIIWKYLTEEQKYRFLKNFTTNKNIKKSLEETTDKLIVDEEEDTEEN